MASIHPSDNEERRADDSEEVSEELVTNMKALKSVLGSCSSFAGMFAGFEGFILNSYVGQDAIQERIEIGFFVLFLSFAFNLFAATLSLIVGVGLQQGLARQWLLHVGRICIGCTAAGSLLFALAFQLYISESPVRTGFQVTVYTVSCALVAIILFFFFAMVRLTLTEPLKRSLQASPSNEIQITI
jgi:hypothetical protein